MDITIILATYKRPEILAKTLESFCHLICIDITWELIIVDNAGDPATCQVIRHYEASLPIFFLTEKKRGKNNALNAALSHASGKVYIFTDDDIIADPHWIESIWQGTLRWPEYNVFGGRILPAWPADKKPEFIEKGDCFFYGAYAIADWDIPEGCYTVRNVYGANMAVRAKLFSNGVKFNPKIGPEIGKQYVMGSETEFLLRMEKAGNKAVWLPGALVYHQIREDQINCKWLLNRAFKNGKSKGELHDFSDEYALICGVPRYLFRQTLECLFQYIRAKITGNEKKIIKKGIQFWFTFGKTYQMLVGRSSKV